MNIKFSDDKTNDAVTTICYGNKTVWDTRAEAINFFRDCLYKSEGIERKMYENIYFDLLAGEKVCKGRRNK